MRIAAELLVGDVHEPAARLLLGSSSEDFGVFADRAFSAASFLWRAAVERKDTRELIVHADAVFLLAEA